MEHLQLMILVNVGILALLFGLQVAGRSFEHGLVYSLSSLDENRRESLFEQRARRVTRNQVEFLVMLSPLALVVSNAPHPVDHWGIIVISVLAGRAAYVSTALLGIPYLRSASWLAAFSGLGLMVFGVTQQANFL